MLSPYAPAHTTRAASAGTAAGQDAPSTRARPLDAPAFTPRERAALAWTEAVTLVSAGPVEDDLYELARAQFTETELVDLTLTIVTINGWNRLSVAFRAVPGSYQLGE